MLWKQQYFLKQVCLSRQKKKKKIDHRIPHCFLISKHMASSILPPMPTHVRLQYQAASQKYRHPMLSLGCCCPERNYSQRVSTSSKRCIARRALPKPNPAFADTGVLKGYEGLSGCEEYFWVIFADLVHSKRFPTTAGWAEGAPYLHWHGLGTTNPYPQRDPLPSHNHSREMCWAHWKTQVFAPPYLERVKEVCAPYPFFLKQNSVCLFSVLIIHVWQWMGRSCGGFEHCPLIAFSFCLMVSKGKDGTRGTPHVGLMSSSVGGQPHERRPWQPLHFQAIFQLVCKKGKILTHWFSFSCLGYKIKPLTSKQGPAAEQPSTSYISCVTLRAPNKVILKLGWANLMQNITPP